MSQTLYRNGSVYSASDPLATAMIVDGDTVAWVGGEDAATSLAGQGMRVVDLAGALVVPGFVDSHAHVTETGISLQTLDLRNVTCAKDLLDAVAQLATATPDSVTIQGFGWDESTWTVRTLPTMAELDRASGGKRVYLSRVDVHSGLISSALARGCGLSVVANAVGSSQVEEEAHILARNTARRLTPRLRADLQSEALHAAAAQGFVAVAEMGLAVPGGEEDLLTLCTQNDVGVQILPYWAELVSSPGAARAVLERFSDAGVELLGLAGDLNIDGSIGTRTALLREEYSDAPGQRGTEFTTVEQAAAHIGACSAVQTQAGFHIIGDAAMDIAVQALRLAAREHGDSAVRRAGHRFEHAEFTDDDAIATMAQLGVTASVQPMFDGLWGGKGGLYEQRLGVRRAALMNRFGSLLAAGVPTALGSDSPVTQFNGWAAVRAALTHNNPRERISARAAFLAHTRGGWRAARSVHPLLGQLVPGAPASFAIWEVDELMVQVAAGNERAFSNDPRARTPLLPALDTENAPRCLRTVHGGSELFDVGAL